MKKILCIIISLIMIFGLCACGVSVDAVGDKVSVRISGIGTKTLTIAVKGELEGCDVKMDYPVDEGGGSCIRPEIKKQSDKQVLCKIKGLESGECLFILRISRDGSNVAQINATISVDSAKKLDCANINFDDTPEFLEIEEKSGGDDDTVRIPYRPDGSFEAIYLKNDGGVWVENTFDASYLDIIPLGTIEMGEPAEEYTGFDVEPVKIGQTSIQFVNREIRKQIVMDFDLVAATAEDGTSYIAVKILGYEVFEYTVDDEMVDIGQAQEMRRIKKIVPGFGFPSGAILSGWSLYNIYTEQEFRFPEGKSLDEVEIPDYVNTISVDAKLDDAFFNYMISSATTVQKECAKIDEVGATASVETVKIAETEVTYYNTTYGFHQAVWEKDGFAYNVTFMHENQKDDEIRDLLSRIVEKK